MNIIKLADQNIKYYIFVRIFAKRVFLPLTAIYFIDTAGLTIRDIGLLSAYFSFIQLLAEVPTGYFADRIGRITSIRLGAILATIATGCYVFFQNRLGIYAGVAFEALGYSFLGGAGEALIHDSLVAKKQESTYTKVMSHNMSISLIINAILVALVPMTYTIDRRLPFAIGGLAYILLFTFSLKLHDLYPPRPKLASLKLPNFSFFITHKTMLLFGLTFGIIAALYSSPNDMLNIALKEYGLSPERIGWVYGLGSLVGALFGPFIHYLRNLKVRHYVLVDLGFLLSLYLAAASRSAIFLAIVMIITIAFWRYRRIIYQSYVLNIYPNAYKATLVSSLNNLEQLSSIWLPLAITASIHASGSISLGLGIIGVATLAISPIYYFAAKRFLHIPSQA